MSTTALKAVLTAVDNLSPALKQINFAARVTRKGLSDLTSVSGKIISTVGKPLALIGGVAGIGGLVMGARGIIGVNAEFEDFQATLTTVLGSAEKAKGAMDWVAEMAKHTPYQLDELTEGFVNLRVYGIDPTQGALEAMGDAATLFNRPLQEATNAIASAMRGNVEMLDQFGIQARIKGEQMVLRWEKLGKRFAASVKKDNPQAIAKAVQYIWNQIAGGTMEKRSHNWNTIISNISDSFEDFMRKVGQAGFFDFAKGKADAFYQTMKRMDDSGTLGSLAGKVSKFLVMGSEKLIGWLERFDENAFIDGIGKTTERLSNLFDEVERGVYRINDLVGGWDRLTERIAHPVDYFFGNLPDQKSGIVESVKNIFKHKPLSPDIAALADKYAAKEGIPPELLKRLIMQESGGDPKAVSVKGAKGLMQLMGPTAKRFGVYDVFDPEQNIAGGSKYLAFLLKRYGGDQAKALAAYNAGEGNVDKYHGVPPFAETQNYVDKILGAGRQNISGDVRVRFENAPAGMRVESAQSNGPVSVTPDVGYRGFATGVP